MKSYNTAVADFAARMYRISGINWESKVVFARIAGMAEVLEVSTTQMMLDIDKAVIAIHKRATANDDGSCYYASDEILGRVYDGYNACDYSQEY